jgi:hypothetical protein
MTNTLHGVDNIYIGNTYTQFILIDFFNKNLDIILKIFPKIKNQEILLFNINNTLFNINTISLPLYS